MASSSFVMLLVSRWRVSMSLWVAHPKRAKKTGKIRKVRNALNLQLIDRAYKKGALPLLREELPGMDSPFLAREEFVPPILGAVRFIGVGDRRPLFSITDGGDPRGIHSQSLQILLGAVRPPPA